MEIAHHIGLDRGPVHWTLQPYSRHAGRWLIYSWGPDRDSNQGGTLLGVDGVYTNYDPTNGTVSIGNIIRTQRDQEKYDKTN